MPKGNRVDISIEEVTRLYLSGMSIREVAEHFGVSHTVIRTRLRDAGVPRRDRSSAQKGRHHRPLVRVTWKCPRCGTIKQVQPGRAKRMKFCSRKCYAQWRSENNLGGPPPRRLYNEPIECEACGTKFIPKYPSSKHPARFCSQECARYHQHITHRGTTWPERTIQALLLGLGINFIPEWKLNGFRADLYLPDYCVAIECDGEYWHSLPTNVRCDFKKTKAFSGAGIPVLHITDGDIKKDLQNVKQQILAFIARHSNRTDSGSAS